MMTEAQEYVLRKAFDMIVEGVMLIQENIYSPADIRERELNVRSSLMAALHENAELKTEIVTLRMKLESMGQNDG